MLNTMSVNLVVDRRREPGSFRKRDQNCARCLIKLDSASFDTMFIIDCLSNMEEPGFCTFPPVFSCFFAICSQYIGVENPERGMLGTAFPVWGKDAAE